MRLLLIFLLMMTIQTSFAQKKRIKYKYKKYERFDFDALDVQASASSPGDLTIGPRFKRKFRNKIPERKNFHPEMKKALDSVL